MHLLVRRYKRNRDKMALYIFVDAAGTERAYIIVEEMADGDLQIQNLSGGQAANTLTYRMGQDGFIPDGREEVLDVWQPNSSEELGEAPTGEISLPPEFDGVSDFRTAPEEEQE